MSASHPVWVRGLKHRHTHHVAAAEPVAPRVGAWIETHNYDNVHIKLPVSHPVWVRGLKPHVERCKSDPPKSHPVWVRGLKQRETMNHIQALLGRTPCGCVD